MKKIANLTIKHTPKISRVMKALQARIHSVKFIRAYIAFRKSAELKAGLTIEAAVSLPLILFMGVSLTLPVKMMDEKRRIQNTMEACAKDMAKAAYASRIIEKGEFFGRKLTEDALSGLEMLETGASKLKILSSLNRDSVKLPIFERADVSDDGIIDFELGYRMKMPFKVMGISDIPMQSRVYRRTWIGADGGRGREEYSDSQSDSAGDGAGNYRDNITVYVGKTGTRYHIDKNCHYLSNKLQAVDASEIDGLRNSSGGKYHACESCRPATSGTVYIMASGTAYHSSENCKSVIAYVEEVKLSDVEHLGPCSYCCKGME